MTKAAALLLLAGVAAAAPAVSAPPTAGRAAPAPADWARTVVATPEGGFRMGNPAATVKLVEYGSLTCGHCANFAKAGMSALVGTYVRSGKVSYEYRSFLLNGLDVAATLVARCGGASRFFPVADKLYATQGQWMGRVGALTAAQKAQMNALPENQRLGRLAELAGITRIAAQHGIGPVQAKRCLADQAALDRLGSIAEAAQAQGVQGTPTFFLNGSNIGTHNWGTLEPILREAAG
ncbi:MAG TPA: thioredoxin domain-containing protein [Allosphingosinicella sp.]|nr:thioredoxin domain-containing protein [Allosphingosinicella sp.]